MRVKKRLGNSVWQFVTPESGGFIPGNNRTLNKATSLPLLCHTANRRRLVCKTRGHDLVILLSLSEEVSRFSLARVCVAKLVLVFFRFQISDLFHVSVRQTQQEDFETVFVDRTSTVIWQNHLFVDQSDKVSNWSVSGELGARHCPLAWQ